MITQIILNQLDSDNNRISYRRDWNKITGSVTATILLQQVYYWYKKNDYKPFYKFKSAPKKPNKLYNPEKADDWCTELGFTEREFDGAINKIGFKFTSKTKEDKHDMFVEYWTDSSRVTHYKLNMVNFLCAIIGFYLTDKLLVSKTTKSDLAKLQIEVYQNYKSDFSKSTKSSLPITDTTQILPDTTTDKECSPLVSIQTEKKETPKSDKKECNPPIAPAPLNGFPICDEDLTPLDVFSFQKFWDQYGNKVDRAKCELKWNRLKKAELSEIERTLPWYIEDTVSNDSEQEKGIWRPRRKNPLTYLNGKTWIDYKDATGPKIRKEARIRDIKRTNATQIIDPSKFDKWRKKTQTT